MYLFCKEGMYFVILCVYTIMSFADKIMSRVTPPIYIFHNYVSLNQWLSCSLAVN